MKLSCGCGFSIEDTGSTRIADILKAFRQHQCVSPWKYTPPPASPEVLRCPDCGSTGACWHVPLGRPKVTWGPTYKITSGCVV